MGKKYIILEVSVIIALLAGIAIYQARRIGLNEGYEPNQPINFSHKKHAGDNQIQCLYCHFAAEKSRHAGIPPVELCFNCHKNIKKDSPEILKLTNALKNNRPIEWIKVHQFPDYAYFNHAQHVRVGKLKCAECHGPVETFVRMKQQSSLSMGQCIDCHRDHNIAPPSDAHSSAGGDCARCHY